MEWSVVLATILGAAVGTIATLATDKLRARYTAEFWLAQERWKLKKDVYAELLAILADLSLAYLDVALQYEEAKRHAEGTGAAFGRGANILATRVLPLLGRLRHQSAMAGLWLSPEVRRVLDGLSDKWAETPEGKEDYRVHHLAAEEAREAVVAAAKGDLELS